MNTGIKSAFVVIVFFFVSLFIYTKLAGPFAFSINNIDNPTPFQTTGTGEVEATPDKAEVSMGVTTNASTADDARSQANTIINKVTSDLISLGISKNDIKTSNFSVYPNNPQQPEPVTDQAIIAPVKPVATSYTATANIDVQTSTVALANKAIDTATNDGANVIGGANFTFNDAQQKKLEQEARVKAVADAKQKAQDLASAAGIKLGKVTNITEGDNPYFLPATGGGAANEAKASDTSLQPGQNTVSITVTLTFETN